MLKCKSIPSTSASALQTKMSRRGKAVGWAAFDLEQRRKLGLEPQAMIESFPSVSSSISRHSKNVALLEKPFASVLQQSVNIPTLRHESNLHESQLPVCSPNACRRTTELVTEYISERSAKKALEMLKEIHPWADGGLIEDVLACTSDNVDKASTLLEEMVSSENCMENKDFETNALKSDTKESPLDGNKLSAGMTLDLAELTCHLQEGLNSNNANLKHEYDADLKMILDSMKHVTIEPEWEEDDVYLIHRKDALQMMRYDVMIFELSYSSLLAICRHNEGGLLLP